MIIVGVVVIAVEVCQRGTVDCWCVTDKALLLFFGFGGCGKVEGLGMFCEIFSYLLQVPSPESFSDLL